MKKGWRAIIPWNGCFKISEPIHALRAQPPATGWEHAFLGRNIDEVCCYCDFNMIENKLSSIEIRDDVFEEYNERLDEANRTLIWESEGHGYYVNKFGRQCVNMPWRTHLYHDMVKKPKFEEYHVK